MTDEELAEIDADILWRERHSPSGRPSSNIIAQDRVNLLAEVRRLRERVAVLEAATPRRLAEDQG